VKVPAPSFALVFLSDAGQTEDKGAPSTTFATTALTKTQNTATIAALVLATSNGHGGTDDPLKVNSEPGNTSRGSTKSGAVGLHPGTTLLFTGSALALGAMLVRRRSFCGENAMSAWTLATGNDGSITD